MNNTAVAGDDAGVADGGAGASRDASGDVSTSDGATSGGDDAAGDASSRDDAGAPNAVVSGSVQGHTLDAFEARARHTSSGGLEQLEVAIGDLAFTCAQLSSSVYSPSTHIVLLSIGALSPDGGAAIAPGVYPLTSAPPAASFAFDQSNAACKVSQLVYADGTSGGTGSITIDDLDGGVRGSFVVTMKNDAGTMAGTFDAPLCDPTELDAGACQ